MASNLELREAEEAYDRLKDVVTDYLSECDSPVPDAVLKHVLRNQMRQLVGAPAEPKRY